MREWERHDAQSRIDSFFEAQAQAQQGKGEGFAKVRSKRLQTAIAGMTGADSWRRVRDTAVYGCGVLWSESCLQASLWMLLFGCDASGIDPAHLSTHTLTRPFTPARDSSAPQGLKWIQMSSSATPLRRSRSASARRRRRAPRKTVAAVVVMMRRVVVVVVQVEPPPLREEVGGAGAGVGTREVAHHRIKLLESRRLGRAESASDLICYRHC